MTLDHGESVGSRRALIVAAVQSPLGFMALAVLVLEAILTLLVLRTDGVNLSILLGGMLILIFGLIGTSLFIIVKHPEVLRDPDVKLKEELTAAKAAASKTVVDVEKALERLKDCQQEVLQLQGSNQILQARLDHLTSLRNRLVAVLHRSDSVGQEEILRELGTQTNPASKEQVLALLGVLIDEGRVVRGSLGGHYKAVSRP